MKTLRGLSLVAALGVSILNAGALGQDEKKPVDPKNVEQTKEAKKQMAKELDEKRNEKAQGHEAGADMMDAWMQANKPGKEHAELVGNRVGDWNVQCKFMMPGMPAQESTAKAACRAMPGMGGRFVQMDYDGEMMGFPFKGVGIYGFNNATKKYESVWFDSTSTNMMISTGEKKADGSIEWRSEYMDPMTKEMKKSRMVDRFPDRDTMVFEMYEVNTDGTEFKAMELTYTRVKSDAPAQGK